MREDNITYLITDKQDFQCRGRIEGACEARRTEAARWSRHWHVKRMYVEEDEVRSHMGSCSPSHTCMHHRTVVVAIEG